MEDAKGFGKVAEFAPGIPHKTVRHAIPSVRHPDVWQFGVHDHHSEGGAGRHFDLRLGHPATGHAHSWAMRHWPGPGETRLAVQQPTHTVKYMDFKGRIESGYGKGRVDLARRGRIEVQSSSNDHVRFQTLDQDPEQYFLRRTNGNKWILKNVTDKTKTAALFHGSPRKLETLQPRSEHGDPRVGPVVFASPSRPFALAYAGGKWGDRDIEQGVRGGSRPRVLLREMRPGALQQVYDRPGYLYTLPEDSFQDANRRTRLELTSPQAVRPIRSERIDNVMGSLRADPAVELHPYDPNHPATRAAVIRQVKRMKEMRPDDAADYRKWRMEVAPPEVRRMLREEEKRAYARAREAVRVPRIDELPSYCGPAALESVLAFHGVDAPQRRLGELGGTTKEKGTTGAGMVRAARHFGFDARLHDGATVDQLRAELARGRPAIVNWWSEDDGHYSVVERVDDRGVHMMDPETASSRTLDRETFDRNWFDFDRGGNLVRHRMITVEPTAEEKVAELYRYAEWKGRSARKRAVVARAVKSFVQHHGVQAAPIVSAGAAMYQQGLRPDFNDIDLYVPGMKQPHLSSTHHGVQVEAFNTWPGMERDGEHDRAHDMGGVKVMSPEQLHRSYSAMGREKDRPHIARLEEHMAKTGELQELEGNQKVAATIQQLEQGVARLPGVVLSQHPVVQAFGAMVAPTKRQLKGRGSKIMMGMQRKLLGSEAFDSIQAAAKDLEHSSLRGKILHSGDVGTHLHPSAPPQVRKDLGTAALMHEALERKGTPGQGLHTLGTELTDFNLVSRLRGGPREDAVRQSMLELRAPEHQHLQEQFAQRFADPRAAEFVTDGSRIPKAMRKAYAREMRPHTHTTVPEASGIMQEQGQVLGGRHLAAQLQNAPTVKLGELAEDGEHKLQGHIDFQGLRIAVENRKGSVRSGTTDDGKKWRTVMKAPYGYIEAPAKGKDGESIDAYVGTKKDAPVAYVVHQHKPDGTGHDEDKVMLGTASEREARRLYLQHYDDPKFLGPIDAVPIERLRELLSKRRKINKLAGVDAGPMMLKAMKPSFKPLGPAANVASLTQKWKPPKAQAPSVPSLPGTPKF